MESAEAHGNALLRWADLDHVTAGFVISITDDPPLRSPQLAEIRVAHLPRALGGGDRAAAVGWAPAAAHGVRGGRSAWRRVGAL